MQKGRKITALFLSVLMLISVLSGISFAVPAKEYGMLPEGYVVVNAAWGEMEYLDTFEYELGGVTYKLEYGQTAAASVDDAQELPTAEGVEKTIVLSPGIYSSTLSITSDMHICGPFFGKNPNNNPNLPDYDPNKTAWAIHNGRSTNEQKEAVFTANISIGNGCYNLTVDGITFTGGATITDSSQSDDSKVVEYHFNNLYFKDASAASVINCSAKTKINRFIYLDCCRFDNLPNVGNNLIYYQALDFTVENSYFYNMNPNLTGSNVSFYLKTTMPSNVIGHDLTVKNVFRGNHFELTGGNNLFNFAAINAQNADIRKFDRVMLTIENNDLVDCAMGNGKIVQDQIEGDNQVINIVGNRFIRTERTGSSVSKTAIGNYRTDTGAKSYAYFNVEKNYFSKAYGTQPITGGYDEIPMYNIGVNYYDNGSGSSATPTVSNPSRASFVDGIAYDESAKYVSTDFDLLNSDIGAISFSGTDESRSASLFLASAKTGVPSFTFKGKDVTYQVYSDSDCFEPLTSAYQPQDGDTIYVKANESTYECVYEVSITNETSDKVDVIRYGNGQILDYNPDMKRIVIDAGKSENGYYVFPADDDVEVATGATYAVYNNEDCSGNPINKIAIQSRRTVAYLKVSANYSSAVYTLIIGSELPDVIPSEGSSDCNLYKMTADNATVFGNEEFGFSILAKDNVRSIKPHVIISGGASYKFYLDKGCTYAGYATDTVKLYSDHNYFYVQVTAEDGTKSAPIHVSVTSVRPSVSYSDYAAIPTYARKAINYLNEVGRGIFTGDEKGNLNPNNDISRYELAKVLVTFAGINVDMAESVKLGEIYDDFYQIQKDASWAIPYIRAAYASGLLLGVSDAKGNLYFDGYAKTTREQFVTAYMRAVLNLSGDTVDNYYKKHSKAVNAAFSNKYADQKKISSWALKSVKLANYLDYVHGDGYNFNPQTNIIRAQVAVIIYNGAQAE